VVKIDLNINTLRPRVVIAPNGGTAWLSDMASSVGALAAINGDYFSGCPDTVPPLNCGEGLTFVDSTDYTDYTGSEWQNRRSLGFNDNYDPNIGWPSEQGGYHRQLLGGGPQVTFGGEYRWRCWYQSYNTEGDCACQNNTVVINDELFSCSANNWWNRPQTFIGFSDDRNTLYLAKSEPGYNKTPHEMHGVLWVSGARYLLKMDGGGSSGMYFNDGGYSFTWNGSRPVANA
ncbi:MAG: phosphodiester glycosidase family protein, partial [Candidatus Kryptoniota bacterium]